jgi:hypothetical protein
VVCLLLMQPIFCHGADDIAVGQISVSVGTARLERGDKSEPLVVGALVYPTDRLVTGPEARVRVKFGDGSVLIVGANTRVEVDTYAPVATEAPVARILRLLGGIVRAQAPTSGDDRGFEIRTRMAVASVRSTEWIVQATVEKTSVFVIEGSVEVSDIDRRKSVILRPGFGTDVTERNLPSEPKKWGKRRVDDVLDRTRLP